MKGRVETVPPVTTEQVHRILIGQMKGIQGHCNSCYMDAALFRSGEIQHLEFSLKIQLRSHYYSSHKTHHMDSNENMQVNLLKEVCLMVT